MKVHHACRLVTGDIHQLVSGRSRLTERGKARVAKIVWSNGAVNPGLGCPTWDKPSHVGIGQWCAGFRYENQIRPLRGPPFPGHQTVVLRLRDWEREASDDVGVMDHCIQRQGQRSGQGTDQMRVDGLSRFGERSRQRADQMRVVHPHACIDWGSASAFRIAACHGRRREEQQHHGRCNTDHSNSSHLITPSTSTARADGFPRPSVSTLLPDLTPI
jgi:hypothetical protein